MLQSIDNIGEFLDAKTAEDFLRDKQLYFAIVKNLEIIGEAAYMLTKEFREAHIEISWDDIIRMRHVLVHGYYQIDSRIIWATVQDDLPELKGQIEVCLKTLD